MAPKRKSARIEAQAAVPKKQLARNKTVSTTQLNKALSDLKLAQYELKRNKMRHALESEEKDDELEMLKTDNHALEKEIKQFKNCKDTKKATEKMQAEYKKIEQSRKRMLEAQSLLGAEQEKKFKEAKPWRQCEICTEEFTKTGARSPRTMSCGHTFCLTCLESMKETYFRTQIRCPTDRKYMYCKDGDLKKLPINYLALHM
ncbi:Protein CBG20820 [Caenorhabditis briggsae]|uniref:Protein CBG20820 n=1 Tax=Caenorhabditis briggsae TaxID=6238 RepID=A8XYP7_CAEBR|nr:Protein CBG20820 [Caenorhabditis briggsae]CAP37763.1 Protein CBG20820 [Caenorhabditis briggsae]